MNKLHLQTERAHIAVANTLPEADSIWLAKSEVMYLII